MTAQGAVIAVIVVAAIVAIGRFKVFCLRELAQATWACCCARRCAVAQGVAELPR